MFSDWGCIDLWLAYNGDARVRIRVRGRIRLVAMY